jgi:hypothetical protein
MVRAPYFTKLGRWANFWIMESLFLATSIPMWMIYTVWLSPVPEGRLAASLITAIPLFVHVGCCAAYYKVILRHLGASAVLFRMHPDVRTMN